MRLVADASVIVAVLLGEGSREERDAMLGEVHAPALLDVEVTQTLRGLLRAGKIDLTTADLGRIELADLPIRRHPDAALLRRAWELRDICTTYDGLYAALAEGLDAALITRDMRLVRRLVDAPAVTCAVRISDAP
ncbi:MAG TPA: type II toxin-antitoxin system VapC family toxin [Solirubrobacteraceae bacterium]|nr:type II toxin-antitoxin system VapC family toxin [Solirubrobacteraceae bacterium]